MITSRSSRRSSSPGARSERVPSCARDDQRIAHQSIDKTHTHTPPARVHTTNASRGATRARYDIEMRSIRRSARARSNPSPVPPVRARVRAASSHIAHRFRPHLSSRSLIRFAHRAASTTAAKLPRCAGFGVPSAAFGPEKRDARRDRRARRARVRRIASISCAPRRDASRRGREQRETSRSTRGSPPVRSRSHAASDASRARSGAP